MKGTGEGPRAAAIRPGARGVGRRSTRSAERVSDDLRLSGLPVMRRRRWAAGLTLLASAAYGVVAAYQYGLLRHLPEPPWRGLDADRVDASGEAYAVGHTPDTALALASAAITLALVGMGPADRAMRRPWLPLLAAGKVAGDAAAGAWLFAEQVTRHHRLCGWCTLAAATAVATVPFTLPEAHDAWRALRPRVTRVAGR